MSGTCSRCGERPRARGHRWCGECQRAARKASRAAASAARRSRLPPPHDHAICHRELDALVREIEQLHETLAAVRGDLAAVRADPRTVPADLGVAPHGLYCLCWACRRARMLAALEGRGRLLSPANGGTR